MRTHIPFGLFLALLALATPAAALEPTAPIPAAHEELGRSLDELIGQLHDLGGRWREHFAPSPRGERPLITLMLRYKDELGLSADQVQSLERLRADFQREAIRRDADLRIAVMDLAALLEKDPVDLGPVEAKLREVERLRVDHVDLIQLHALWHPDDWDRTMAAGGALEAIDRELFSEDYLIRRPLLDAISADGGTPPVLLIDEVDRADEEFEAFLLEVLSDFQVSVPELGTVRARHIPLVVLTSNNARELSDGLKRRCLHLFIDFPTPADELAIIRLKVPEVPAELAKAVVNAVQKIRAMDLRKLPSVSESLDWARSLVILNAQELDPAIVESTLSMLVKHEKDLERVRGALDKVLAE